MIGSVAALLKRSSHLGSNLQIQVKVAGHLTEPEPTQSICGLDAWSAHFDYMFAGDPVTHE